MAAAAALGVLQGIVEWLPVSSEGIVAGAYAFIFDASFEESVGFALWLHVGTIPSVLVVFRRDILTLIQDAADWRRKPSPPLRFLLIATIVSGAVGLPLILTLSTIASEVLSISGPAAAGVIGVFMLATGYVQLVRRDPGERGRCELTSIDGVLVGVAQGLSVIPGLSRSGLTVSVLLSRRVDREQALSMSFLLSVPASLAASIFVAVDSGVAIGAQAVVSASAAFVVGMLTIKGLMAIAARMNFGWLVIAVGAVMIAGSLITWRL